jgi:hypothetical protein
MTNKDLEEKIYEFGNVLYQIGRMETDGKDTSKEYNKMCKRREQLTDEFSSHFKTGINMKVAKTLDLI